MPEPIVAVLAIGASVAVVSAPFNIFFAYRNWQLAKNADERATAAAAIQKKYTQIETARRCGHWDGKENSHSIRLTDLATPLHKWILEFLVDGTFQRGDNCSCEYRLVLGKEVLFAKNPSYMIATSDFMNGLKICLFDGDVVVFSAEDSEVLVSFEKTIHRRFCRLTKEQLCERLEQTKEQRATELVALRAAAAVANADVEERARIRGVIDTILTKISTSRETLTTKRLELAKDVKKTVLAHAAEVNAESGVILCGRELHLPVKLMVIHDKWKNTCLTVADEELAKSTNRCIKEQREDMAQATKDLPVAYTHIMELATYCVALAAAIKEQDTEIERLCI